MQVNHNFEDYLKKRVNEGTSSITKQAMEYSLMNGGKRVRPALLFAVLKGYGMDETIGYPCACAIEMIHTYSLIHDDLPAMDNDDLRRGKASCHKAFDEATAILAGDGLLTRAFEVCLDSDCSSSQKVELIHALSSYAGVDGMIYGQTLDLMAEKMKDCDLEFLLNIHHYKTSELLTLPLICGAILAGHAEDLEHFKTIGLTLGLEFQIQDDILDVTSSQEVVGKSLSDQENDKITAVSLLGLEKAQSYVEMYDQQMRVALELIDFDKSYLVSIFDALLKRKY